MNLRAKGPEVSLKQQETERNEKVAQVLERVPQVLAAPARSVETENTAAREIRKASIFFVYNAHEWECHEVLGIPRDSDLQKATEKYQYLIQTADPSTFDFYTAAYQALLSHRSLRK